MTLQTQLELRIAKLRNRSEQKYLPTEFKEEAIERMKRVEQLLNDLFDY